MVFLWGDLFLGMGCELFEVILRRWGYFEDFIETFIKSRRAFVGDYDKIRRDSVIWCQKSRKKTQPSPLIAEWLSPFLLVWASLGLAEEGKKLTKMMLLHRDSKSTPHSAIKVRKCRNINSTWKTNGRKTEFQPTRAHSLVTIPQETRMCFKSSTGIRSDVVCEIF